DPRVRAEMSRQKIEVDGEGRLWYKHVASLILMPLATALVGGVDGSRTRADFASKGGVSSPHRRPPRNEITGPCGGRFFLPCLRDLQGAAKASRQENSLADLDEWDQLSLTPLPYCALGQFDVALVRFIKEFVFGDEIA